MHQIFYTLAKIISKSYKQAQPVEYARMSDINSNAFPPTIFHIDDALICEQGKKQADGLKSLIYIDLVHLRREIHVYVFGAKSGGFLR